MGLSAIGATMAMLPLIFVFMLVALGAMKDNYSAVGLLNSMAIVQAVGCFVWAAGLFMASGVMNKLGLPGGPATGAAFVVLLAGVFQIVFFVASKEFVYRVIDTFGADGAGWVVLILYFGVQIGMWFFTSKMARHIGGVGNSRNGIALITIVSFLLVIVTYALAREDSYASYKALQLVMKVSAVVLFSGAVWSVCGWWRAVSGAEKASADGEGSGIVAQVTDEVPAQSGHGLDDELNQKLMGYDNIRLKEIVDHPDLYANKAYVAAAESILKKRSAWEMINAKSDEELIEIVRSEGLYDYAVLDAASMELASRQSPAFMEEMRSYTPGQLRQIVTNPESYYDGYVKVARQILDENEG